MAVGIQGTERKPGMIEGQLGTIGGMLGKAVGTYYGGPAGGAVGGTIGGAIGGAAAGEKAENVAGSAALDLLKQGRDGGNAQPSAPVPNSDEGGGPVGRWQESQKNIAMMNQGMKALESNPQLKQNFAPILSEAMKRAQMGGQV